MLNLNLGQLGHGYVSEQVSLPTMVPAASGTWDSIPLQISGGGSHIIFYDSKDEVYSFFHLGLVHTKLNWPTHQFLPKPQKQLSSTSEYLCSGWDFSLFLDCSGNSFSVGDNRYCQLGRPLSTLGAPGSDTNDKFSPVWDAVPFSKKLRNISAGMRHVTGICEEDSSLCVWGDNSKGQTGLNIDLKVIPEPTVVKNLNFIPCKARCSKTTTIVLSEDGYFYGAGVSKFGMLGSQAASKPLIPVFVKLFELEWLNTSGIQIKDFQCGWNHVLVISHFDLHFFTLTLPIKLVFWFRFSWMTVKYFRGDGITFRNWVGNAPTILVSGTQFQRR